MRAPRLGIVLVSSLAACSQNGFVRVTVEASGAGQPPVFQIRSVANDSTSGADGGAGLSALGPKETNPISFPKTFVVELPPSATTLTEIVEELDADGNTVLRGSNSAIFSAGAQATGLTVTLSQPCNSGLDCDPQGFCQGQVVCTPQGACIATGSPAPPGFGTPCGNDGGRCTAEAICIAPFGSCGDGTLGLDPLPDGGVFQEQCDWGDGASGSACAGPDGGCNSDTAANACRTGCLLPSCGDGVVDEGEKCDLGAQNGTRQGCNATCTLLGNATRIVGNGDQGCPSGCYQNGPGDQAMFQEISGLAVVGTTLYVADTLNEVIRAVDLASAPTYNVTTLAGNPAVSMTGDGAGGDAGFFLPVQPMAYQGTLLVGTGCNIRQITLPGAVVTTLAGPTTNSTADAPGPPPAPPMPFLAAGFNNATGLAFDPDTGLVYSVDKGAGAVKRLDMDAGMVSFLAGEMDGTQFQAPTSAAVANGGLFVTDTNNNLIKRVSLSSADGGAFVTVVGGISGTGFADSTAPNGAAFDKPEGICTDGKTLYIVDQNNGAVRQMDPVNFQVTTVVGGPDAGIFDSPYGCVVDPATGILYVSDEASPAASPDGKGNVIYMVQ